MKTPDQVVGTAPNSTDGPPLRRWATGRARCGYFPSDTAIEGSSWETVMAADEQIHRLNRELSRHSLGPVIIISNQIVASLASGLQSLATWLR